MTSTDEILPSHPPGDSPEQSPADPLVGRVVWSFGPAQELPSAPSSDDLAIGRRFGGRFQVRELLGQGGMGVVFRAHDVEVDRPVAIKLMKASVDRRVHQRFQREGELTARLTHPGIVRVHGGGFTTDDEPFLVLELVEGARPLDEHLREVDRRAGFDLLLQVSRAVGVAHREGVVHRDLKPNNVLVGADGRARVCDFGLARAEDVDRLTKSGELLGTPHYMGPERFQAHADGLGPPTDVWALGVMLYEHATGRLPFVAPSLAGLIGKVSGGELTAPRQLAPDLPPEVEAVILRCLANKPAGRYSDADALADALDLALAAAPGGERRSPWRLVGGLVGIAVAAAALWFMAPPPSDAPAPAPRVAEPTESADRADDPVQPPEGDVRARLEALVTQTRQLEPLRQELWDRFEGLRQAAGARPELAAEVRLEQLDYAFRRGRWNRVLEEAETLSSQGGDVAARGLLLQTMVAYAGRDQAPELGPRFAARCARRWAEGGESPSGLTLAVAAWGCVLSNDLDQALTLGERAHAQQPKLAEALLVQAVVHGRRLQFGAATALLERALTLTPDHPIGLELLAIAAARQDQRARCAEVAKTLYDLHAPAPPQRVVWLRVAALAGLKAHAEALPIVEAQVEARPSDPAWRFHLGWLLTCFPDRRWSGLELLEELTRAHPGALDERHYAQLNKEARDKIAQDLRAHSPEEIRGWAAYERAERASRAGDAATYIAHLERSVAAGNTEAMQSLARALAKGEGVTRDPRRAFELYGRVAQEGLAAGHFNVGACHAQGVGTPQDFAAARRSYALAVDGGEARAMVNLAHLLEHGRGGPRDPDRALALLMQAADAESGYALLGLADWFARRRNHVEAQRWLRRALAHEDPEVQRHAERVLRRLRR
jgi:TPR repeat protein